MGHFYIVFVQKSLVFALFINLEIFLKIYALALKSLGRDTVSVQVRSRAPILGVKSSGFALFSRLYTVFWELPRLFLFITHRRTPALVAQLNDFFSFSLRVGHHKYKPTSRLRQFFTATYNNVFAVIDH